MKTKKHILSLVSLVTLLVMVISQGLIANWVICHGIDGHVAVEIAHNTCCSHGDSQSHSKPDNSQSSIDAKPISCIDIDIENHAIVHSINKQRKVFSIFCDQVSNISFFTIANNLRVLLIDLPPPTGNTALTALRTIVLLN